MNKFRHAVHSHPANAGERKRLADTYRALRKKDPEAAKRLRKLNQEHSERYLRALTTEELVRTATECGYAIRMQAAIAKFDATIAEREATAIDETNSLKAECEKLLAERRELAKMCAATAAEINELSDECEALLAEIEALKRSNASVTAEIENIRRFPSWGSMAPPRRLLGSLSRRNR